MIPGKKIIVLLFIKFPLVISAGETLRDPTDWVQWDFNNNSCDRLWK